MDDPFHDAGDDSEQGGGLRSSIEALLANFRETSSHQDPQASGKDSEEPGPSDQSQSEPEGDSSEEWMPEEKTSEPGAETTPVTEPGPESGPKSRTAGSPVEMIEETMAAFRKAERQAEGPDAGERRAEEQARTEKQSQTEAVRRQGRAERPEETSSSKEDSEREPVPADGPSPEEEPSFEVSPPEEDSSGAESSGGEPGGGEAPGGRAEGEEEDEEMEEAEETISSEDLAPAFRRALSEREGPEPSGLEEGGPGGDSQPPSEPEVRQTSVRPSQGGSEASREALAPSPSGPEASFLWVTDQAEGRPKEASVPVDELSAPRALKADALLLEGGGEAPSRVLRRIRGHPDVQVYLKPVFWRRAPGQESPVAHHVDGTWKREGREALRALREQAVAINDRIGTLMEMGGGGKEGMELRVLRFMATRNHEFAPQRTAENSDGFVYPKLTPLLEQEPESGGGELSQILSMLDERRLLTGEFVMRQHACRNCGCAFLNFEEMCPHCGATELDTDDLVHHFRCAFTGALSEYKKEEGELVCPKCDRRLKQIGVDYDKPSVVHTCQRCHEEFQNPEVQTTCYRCGHTSPPEQQVKRQIKKYEITALGEETAIYGLSDSLLSILERESRVLDYATFQLIIESEAARIERYQRSTSSLLLVRVTELKQLRMELGERSQEVIEEIATAFDNTLRSSDYLSARDESLYLFLLTETDEEGARRAGERLEGNIEGVLSQNLAHPPELDIAVQPLRPGIDLDGLAEQFLASSPSRDSDAVNRR